MIDLVFINKAIWRYGLESDPSVVLIFDTAGFIAGVQNVVLASDVNFHVNPAIDDSPFYQVDFAF